MEQTRPNFGWNRHKNNIKRTSSIQRVQKSYLVHRRAIITQVRALLRSGRWNEQKRFKKKLSPTGFEPAASCVSIDRANRPTNLLKMNETV